MAITLDWENTHYYLENSRLLSFCFVFLLQFFLVIFLRCCSCSVAATTSQFCILCGQCQSNWSCGESCKKLGCYLVPSISIGLIKLSPKNFDDQFFCCIKKFVSIIVDLICLIRFHGWFIIAVVVVFFFFSIIGPTCTFYRFGPTSLFL